MSRETYQPPSLSQNQSSNPGASSSTQQQQQSSTGAFNLTGQQDFGDDSKPVKYLCGQCDLEISLKKGDGIRCRECGYRVLYKQRTERMVQFEAR